jgi:2-iminobutanoate/2-iminopropanoate deaminase
MNFRALGYPAVLLLSLFAVSGHSDRRFVVGKATQQGGLPFSDGVQVGNTLYIAGHIGLDPKTNKPGATPEQEARLVMDGIKETVESAGMSMNDVVSVQVFCTDLSFYDAFNAVYRTYFPTKQYPARAFIGAAKLLRGGRYEVMGIAIKPSK